MVINSRWRFRNGEVEPKAQFEKSECELKNSPDGKSNGLSIRQSAQGTDVTVDMPNGKASEHSITHL